MAAAGRRAIVAGMRASTSVCRALLAAALAAGCGAGTPGADPTAPRPPPLEAAAADLGETARPPAPDAAAAKEAVPVPGGLVWELRAQPPRLTMAERDRFQLMVRVTNRGDRTVDPALHLAQFTVDGEPCMGCALAFGNGVMERGWAGLAPGQSVETGRGIGEILFERPGARVVELTHGSSRASVTIRVLP